MSFAIPATSATMLGRAAEAARRTDPARADGESGFRLLPQGDVSFNARIALARRAERSLDVQYYEIRNDNAGRVFVRELRDAALRGVRVRVLVDDFYAAGEDDLFLGLASHPNVQLRIYNPFPSRAGGFGSRLLFSMHEFSRVNRRMHNKLFLADNSFAVIGGRNIADDYFMRHDEANFVDIDAIATGGVVSDLSAAFDRYWNSAQSYPIEELAYSSAGSRAPADMTRLFDAVVAGASDVPQPARDLFGAAPIGAELDDGRLLALSYARAQVLADLPTKSVTASQGVQGAVAAHTLELFSKAIRTVQIVSPYFIPGERGMRLIKQGIEAGVRVELITNSASTTDEPLVYASYRGYRLAMLRAGVRIYELRPDLAGKTGRLGDFGRSLSRLHVKSAVVDSRYLFVGSMNMDARSDDTNTEMGVFIDSPSLVEGEHGANRLLESLKASAYELRLSNDSTSIEWIERGTTGAVVVHKSEPGLSAWQDLKLRMLGAFVSEALL